MSRIQFAFLEPVDVLLLRGNRGYGEAGCYGESYAPPPPSVIAGALRSRILLDDAADLSAFAQGRLRHPAIGTPDEPGSFRVMEFHVGRRYVAGRLEALAPLPADLAVFHENGRPVLRAMHPLELPFQGGALSDSYPLPKRPVLAEKSRGKAVGGYWLTERALRGYLAGRLPQGGDLVRTEALWGTEARVGVGLDPDKRSALEGRLFTTEAIAMTRRLSPNDTQQFDAGFLVGVEGCDLPQGGMLRVGGDGRAMAIHPAGEYQFPEPDYEAIARAGGCRMVLASPGVFQDGWLPTGVERDGGRWRFELHGVRARLVAARLPRAGLISGWDLARETPKPALRVAPTGSVYWLEGLEANADQLRKLVRAGLWSELYLDPVRRAEGFNRIWLAEWMRQE